jgi:hypothetical protein
MWRRLSRFVVGDHGAAVVDDRIVGGQQQQHRSRQPMRSAPRHRPLVGALDARTAVEGINAKLPWVQEI